MNNSLTLEQNNIPWDTTHVELAREIDFDQRPSFFKFGFDFYGPDSGTLYNCWYHWYHGAWHKDYGYQKPKDDPNRLITVKEYKERLLLNV